MNRLRLSIFLLAMTGPPQAARAQDTAPLESSLPGRVEAALRQAEAVVSLQADFVQDKIAPFLRKPLRSTGRVEVKGPCIRWTVEAPRPSVLLVSRQDIRVYYPEQSRMEIYEPDGALAGFASSPLPRMARLREQFDLRLDGEAWRDGFALQLIPRADALRKHLSWVRVEVSDSDGIARRIVWADPDGERTEITLSGIRVNPDISDRRFTLAPPEGTTVVRPLRRDP